MFIPDSRVRKETQCVYWVIITHKKHIANLGTIFILPKEIF